MLWCQTTHGKRQSSGSLVNRLGFHPACDSTLLPLCLPFSDLNIDPFEEFRRHNSMGIKEFLKRSPDFLFVTVKTIEESLMSWLTEAKIAPNLLCGLVLRYPKVLSQNLSDPKMLPNIYFLENVLCRDVSETLGIWPAYVSFTLLRIFERTEFLKRQKVNIDKENLTFLKSTDGDFWGKYGPTGFSSADWAEFQQSFASSDWMSFYPKPVA